MNEKYKRLKKVRFYLILAAVILFVIYLFVPYDFFLRMATLAVIITCIVIISKISKQTKAISDLISPLTAEQEEIRSLKVKRNLYIIYAAGIMLFSVMALISLIAGFIYQSINIYTLIYSAIILFGFLIAFILIRKIVKINDILKECRKWDITNTDLVKQPPENLQ